MPPTCSTGKFWKLKGGMVSDQQPGRYTRDNLLALGAQYVDGWQLAGMMLMGQP